MSVGEAIGLALTCALIGGVLGAALARAAFVQGTRRHQERLRFAEDLASWLAVRRILTDAILHSVASQRALMGIDPQSPFLSGRQMDARQATRGWTVAAGALARAETRLSTVYGLKLPSDLRGTGAGVNLNLLRQAIEGDDAALATLREALSLLSRNADSWVRETLDRWDESKSRRNRLKKAYSALGAWGRSFGRRRL